MPAPLVECVPNFSEGRDRDKVERIAAGIRTVPGIHVLDIHIDPDHNRSVITFAGDASGVEEASVRGVGMAVSLIDMNLHRGEHPRIGAADVVPFVPLRNCSLADCVAIAHRAGEQINERFQIPVYFYEAAALLPPRVNLAYVRAGGFEGLQNSIGTDPARRPDVGDARLHLTAGATAVGARNLLIAFNINLNSDDKKTARVIASKVRQSSGGLPAVKAMGVLLKTRSVGGEHGQAQVSMNLTDWKQTSLQQAFDAVEREASQVGVTIQSTEIVGLAPAGAFAGSTPESLRLQGFGPGTILENRLAEALGEPV